MRKCTNKQLLALILAAYIALLIIAMVAIRTYR